MFATLDAQLKEKEMFCDIKHQIKMKTQFTRIFGT
jgi:hypothetical protein